MEGGELKFLYQNTEEMKGECKLKNADPINWNFYISIPGKSGLCAFYVISHNIYLIFKIRDFSCGNKDLLCKETDSSRLLTSRLL